MNALTVAIPFYQNPSYLHVAIESVRLQSSPDWRLLVVDDSAGREPEERVRAVIDSFGDERIRYIRNVENRGIVANWNYCLDEARGDLITLLHGDDRLLPGYVELMTGLAAAHPDAVAFYCAARIIDRDGKRAFSLLDAAKRFFAPAAKGDAVLRGEQAAAALMAGNFIMCPTLCFQTAILGTRRFSEEWSQVQDLELTVRLLMEDETLIGSREAAYAYRRHAESTTAAQSESMVRFDEEFRLFDRVADRANACGWPDAEQIARRKRIVKLHLLYRTFRELLRLRPQRALATLRYLGSRR